MPQVILVDFNDCEIGRMEKYQAHREAKLHRAFSVFLYRNSELLLQKRAASKYHCGGLWTNTCCSHPHPGEVLEDAAIRRLREETGIRASRLKEIHQFVYYFPFSNGITEFEFDHVLVNTYNGNFAPNFDEVEELRWIPCDQLAQEMMDHPGRFTPWFLICAPVVMRYMQRETDRGQRDRVQ